MHTVYMMGFDVWAEGDSETRYLDVCRNAPKYKKGQWFVLENDEGKLVSSLICYRNVFGLAEGCVGIGSVATSPDQRKKGYAAILLKDIITRLRETTSHIFLYSDIAPAFYKKLGFQILNDDLQKHKPSLCMVYGADLSNLNVPSYF